MGRAVVGGSGARGAGTAVGLRAHLVICAEREPRTRPGAGGAALVRLALAPASRYPCRTDHGPMGSKSDRLLPSRLADPDLHRPGLVRLRVRGGPHRGPP